MDKSYGDDFISYLFLMRYLRCKCNFITLLDCRTQRIGGSLINLSLIVISVFNVTPFATNVNSLNAKVAII